MTLLLRLGCSVPVPGLSTLYASPDRVFVASAGGKSAKLQTDLSVRPTVPYATTLTAGHLRDGDKDIAVARRLYPEFRTQQASISYLPLGLSRATLPGRY